MMKFQQFVFLKYKRRIGLNPCIVKVGAIESIDIDYE